MSNLFTFLYICLIVADMRDEKRDGDQEAGWRETLVD
jgi:hypothetical protein